MNIEITVRIYRRHFPGDTYSYIENYIIKEEGLSWWQQRSGRGDFDLLGVKR